MTTLIVEELRQEPISQDFRLKLDTRNHIASLSPYLYIHNAPAGTFTFTLTGNGVNKSWDFTCNDIKTAMATTDNYIRVYYPIVPLSPLYLKKGVYTVTLTYWGYSYDDDSFIAWVKEHEDVDHFIEYVPGNDEDNPFSLRIKVFEQGINR